MFTQQLLMCAGEPLQPERRRGQEPQGGVQQPQGGVQQHGARSPLPTTPSPTPAQTRVITGNKP